ncbi:MAG: chromosome segregation protein SMC [Balneolaceae bacterium]|nr:MAG: chromosome segregation protein SMC [Balneolaceae bacterium]
MYISELELHGFKSFAHKTHVKFDNGITAIVGPNGCGKSNIVDALRWVLGEQRPTLLRSSSMSNVIFNGTAKKKALGMADVSLTFINNKGILPVEYSELTITRRLYRSGESEYLINGTPCRLKDIMDLFMDTGMSSDAYSVIELKMVEEILNDRNNDRRRLFEEAAGVTRYKEKRRQTLRKLDETLKDLQRLEDILVEIRKKVRSLELQAEKAVKAKNFKSELELLDKAYTLSEYKLIKGELDPLQNRIINAGKEKTELAESVSRLEAQEETARAELIEKERIEAEYKRKSTQLHSSIRDLETTLRILKEKIVNEESVIKQYTSDIEQSQLDLQELEAIKIANETALEKLVEEIRKSEKSLNQSKETFSEVQQKYASKRHQLYELEITVSDLNQKLTGLQSSRIKLESRLENSEDDHSRIAKDILLCETQISASNESIIQLKSESELLTALLEKQESELNDAVKRKSELREKREKVLEEIRALKSQAESASSEISILNSIADSNEATPGSVTYLLEEHSEKFNLLAPAGDLIQTSEEFVFALEAALGDTINFVVTGNLDEARLAASILKESGKGRATFIPMEQLQSSYTIVGNSILDHVDVHPEFRPLAELLLGQILLVSHIDDAVDQLSKNRDAIAAVTPGGDLITHDLFLRGGSQNQQAVLRLGLKDKLDKLGSKRDLLTDEKHLKEKLLDDLNDQIESIHPELLRQANRQSLQDYREIEKKMNRFQSEIEIYKKNIDDLVKRQYDLAGSRDAAADELEELQPRQKEHQKRISQLFTEQEQLKEELQSLEETRAIAQNRYNDARLKHQDLSNKTDNLQKDLERAVNGISGIRARLESRTKLQKESRERIQQHNEQIETHETRLEQTLIQKESADEQLQAAEQKSSRQRGLILEIDKELKELRRRKEVNLELVHHLSMAREKFELQAQNLADHIWETYEVLIGQLTETLPEEMELPEAKERISALRQRLQRIGEVNPLAIQEFDEEKERLDFYESQTEDLHKAESEMRETINEINLTATERFTETFESIRHNFKSVFSTLFHEDDYCDLLIDENPEDPLEAKIEIRANPKGKRPSGINQLSGGEKTLTAIALLFAIYLVKPSPFCVLDEVDAPLDDANIERFAQMIRKFSDDTQFIIITHNKKTMSKAEMMYGVTMPEIGVSRLVGVKLDEVAEAG